MLDNGYVYLAGARLSLFRSSDDWAIVFEIFGFSPRAGFPDTFITTIASTLRNRPTEADFVTAEALQRFLANNRHNQSRAIFPVEEGNWLDPDDPEYVSGSASSVHVREVSVEVPAIHDYAKMGIDLQEQRPLTFELCRFLAEVNRELVLATIDERRVNVPEELQEVLVLDDWQHPDLAGGQKPSETRSFVHIAQILTGASPDEFDFSTGANTHWKNWPDGGTL